MITSCVDEAMQTFRIFLPTWDLLSRGLIGNFKKYMCLSVRAFVYLLILFFDLFIIYYFAFYL